MVSPSMTALTTVVLIMVNAAAVPTFLLIFEDQAIVVRLLQSISLTELIRHLPVLLHKV